MAKDEDTQLQLIDVDDPKLADVKRELKAYDNILAENREQGAANRQAEKAKRARVLEKVEAAKLKPGPDGVYRLTLDGKTWEISQEAQLKIKKHAAPKEESEDDEPDPEIVGEGEEQASRRGRASKA